MFTLVAMPLHEFFSVAGSEQVGFDAHRIITGMLAEALGREVTWDDGVASEEHVVDNLDAYAVYALCALAAWLELHETLEGFAPGEAPWRHEALMECVERDHCARFPQLLLSRAWLATFLPVELPTVFMLSYAPGAADALDEDDATGDEGLALAVGSLRQLADELHVLGEHLGMPAVDDDDAVHAEALFDADVDPLAAARLAWLVWSAQTRLATRRGLPLMVVEELDEDESATAIAVARDSGIDDLLDDIGIDDWDDLE